MQKEAERLREDSVWSSAQVAAFLGTSIEAVRIRVNRGKLPYRKIGGRLYFSELEVRRLFLGETKE